MRRLDYWIKEPARSNAAGSHLEVTLGDQMRNVIFGINITLDGCCDHTTQFADEETHEYWTGVLREAGLLVYGRKTYELMVPYWPEVLNDQSATKADTEFARAFVSINKIVFFTIIEQR